MKFTPLRDRLLVTRVGHQTQEEGSIVIPDSAREKRVEGKVIAVGSGRVLADGERVPLAVKVGDRVLLGKYAGTEIKIDEQEHVIVRENEVLGIIQ